MYKWFQTNKIFRVCIFGWNVETGDHRKQQNEFYEIMLDDDWLTPRSRVRLEKLTDLQQVKKFPAYYGTSEVRYRIYKFPPPFPLLSQINPALAPASHFFTLFQMTSLCPMLYEMFRQMVSFYGDELLSPHPTTKLEDHLSSAVRDCLFSILAATLHI